MIPKFLSADRPEQGPYEHFAAVAGFPEQTGWGMNFMTDCYVNYGYVAVVAGALILGLIYWGLFSYAVRHIRGRYIFAGAIAAYPFNKKWNTGAQKCFGDGAGGCSVVFDSWKEHRESECVTRPIILFFSFIFLCESESIHEGNP